jgi:hypothetical protein
MVQAHAQMAGIQSRATTDVDMLIDVLADTDNIKQVITGLESIGFIKQEPGLRGSPFHRLKRDKQIVDILIAEHLPTGKQKAAKVDRLTMMETPGGAQALSRRMTVVAHTTQGQFAFCLPDELGALILKSAAWKSDTRNKERHLEDAALLASLIPYVATELNRLHGSDKKRLRAIYTALQDSNHPAWLQLPPDQRIQGHDTLRILAT